MESKGKTILGILRSIDRAKPLNGVVLSLESHGQPLRSCFLRRQTRYRPAGQWAAMPADFPEDCALLLQGSNQPFLPPELPFALLTSGCSAAQASSWPHHIWYHVFPAGALLLCWKLLVVHLPPTCPLLSGGSSCDPSQPRQPLLTSAVVK